jgi:hypothetical protein
MAWDAYYYDKLQSTSLCSYKVSCFGCGISDSMMIVRNLCGDNSDCTNKVADSEERERHDRMLTEKKYKARFVDPSSKVS